MDWFFILFLAVIALISLHQLFLGIQAVRTGETIYYFRYHYRRVDQPRMFWWVTGRRLIGPFVIFIIIFVLNNLGAAWP